MLKKMGMKSKVEVLDEIGEPFIIKGKFESVEPFFLKDHRYWPARIVIQTHRRIVIPNNPHNRLQLNNKGLWQMDKHDKILTHLFKKGRIDTYEFHTLVPNCESTLEAMSRNGEIEKVPQACGVAGYTIWTLPKKPSEILRGFVFGLTAGCVQRNGPKATIAILGYVVVSAVFVAVVLSRIL